MTNIVYPWEPPLAGTEADHLIGALDRLRTTFRWKADDLDADGLQTRIGASSLTLGGLLKHLAAVEDYIFTIELSGRPIGAPWDAAGWDGSNDCEFASAATDTPISATLSESPRAGTRRRAPPGKRLCTPAARVVPCTPPA
jgi:hypothetical protein